MAILSTDFQNEIINETINTKRKYFMTDNDDGTVSFTDNTSYTQVGTEYGAEEIIEEREQINQHTNVIGSDEFNPESPYSAGDYFIYNNKLCKALSAISAGAALSLGNNYQVTSLENEISGLNGNLGGKIVYAKATSDIKTYSFYMFPVPNNYHLRAFIASYTTDDVFYRSYDVAKIENNNFYLNNADGFESGTTAQVIAFFD